MPLPDVIEIVPLGAPVSARITIPGSKSITNRALVLAALSNSTVTLTGALWSEDTQVMVECLKKLGFDVFVKQDPGEDSNRIITVLGTGGTIPLSGTEEKPLELFVGNAGTAARFLAALVCLGKGHYRLHGVARMHERPQADLFRSLRELGYEVLTPNDKLPATIRGTGPNGGSCSVSIKSSSQFASALLLCSNAGKWNVTVTGENAEESPYVAMTTRLMEIFPWGGGVFLIEPDSSSGSYFVAANWMLSHHFKNKRKGLDPSILHDLDARTLVQVQQWPTSSWQIDSSFPKFLPLPAEISRLTDLGDSIMTAMIVAADGVTSAKSAKPVTDIELLEAFDSPTDFRAINFKDLGRLRVQECERVEAMRTELARCGTAILETGQTLMIVPSLLHGAEIETYNDHRMAMCFATLGLCIPGLRIKNPSCVKKTFPNFFQKLAAPAPGGLGVEILDAKRRQKLTETELFAD